MPPLAPDVRRAATVLFSVAVVSVALAAVYANHYLFQGELGQTLPDISPSSGELVLGFQVVAVMCIVWAGLLAYVAQPAHASRAVGAWSRVREAERVRPFAVGVACLLAAAYAAGRFLLNEETVHAPLADLTAGEAVLPFQYRTLVPWLVRGLGEVPAFAALPPAVQYAPFEFAAALACFAAVAYLLDTVVRDGSAARVAALGVFVPLAFNLVAPWRYNAIYFPYDTPSVAAFALGIALLLRGRLVAYYVLFVVATLNRETTCFLTMVHLALLVGTASPGRALGHVGGQAAIWVGIKALVALVYASNAPLDPAAGGLFADMIGRSVRILVTVPGLVYVGFVTMGGLGAVLALLWGRVDDERVRRVGWVVAPFVAGMFVVGEMMEVRIYSEWVPLVSVGLVLVVRSVVTEAASRAPAPVFETAPS